MPDLEPTLSVVQEAHNGLEPCLSDGVTLLNNAIYECLAKHPDSLKPVSEAVGLLKNHFPNLLIQILARLTESFIVTQEGFSFKNDLSREYSHYSAEINYRVTQVHYFLCGVEIPWDYRANTMLRYPNGTQEIVHRPQQ